MNNLNSGEGMTGERDRRSVLELDIAAIFHDFGRRAAAGDNHRAVGIDRGAARAAAAEDREAAVLVDGGGIRRRPGMDRRYRIDLGSGERVGGKLDSCAIRERDIAAVLDDPRRRHGT